MPMILKKPPMAQETADESEAPEAEVGMCFRSSFGHLNNLHMPLYCICSCVPVFVPMFGASRRLRREDFLNVKEETQAAIRCDRHQYFIDRKQCLESRKLQHLNSAIPPVKAQAQSTPMNQTHKR